ncbi:hypothetical protein E4T42_03130 [Aureobasidium subglaciale]|nr:hypothetical protein E4T42_03130 [Aureobasidium subglaciale]
MSRCCRRENIAWKSVAWQSRLRIFLMSVAWMTMSSVGCASEVVRFHVLCSDDTAYAGCNTADGVLLSTDDRNISMPGVLSLGNAGSAAQEMAGLSLRRYCFGK